MRKFLQAFFCIAILTPAAAQQHQTFVDPGHLTCKTHERDKELMLQHGIDPLTNPALLSYEQWMQDYTASHTGERGGVYIIPIVFHIVHAGGFENISDAQVYDALAILNRDFRKMNADTTAVVAPFKSIVADCEIEFRLAQKDAQGNCVSGITRTYSVETFVGEEDMVDDVNLNLNNGVTATNVRFPRDKYLNIWICANPSGAAGYTTTPFFAFNPNYDGIWISHAYFGSIGTSNATKSRALTHEVGHWLNLSHVWGNSNNPGVSCGNDGVSDTPETEGWQSCNLSGATCGNPIDNVQNYMEYSYCSRMFTAGQKARMHAALNAGTAQRNNLWSASNLVITGTDGPDYLCAADFNADEQIICTGDSVSFTDLSFHGPSGWTWTFPGGSPASSTSQSPVVTYNTPGVYSVTLSVTNGVTNTATTKTSYITVLSPTGISVPYFQNFENHTPLPNSEFYLENADGQQEWELFTGAGSSGTHCLKLDNTNNLNGATKDAFVSTTMNLSSLADITFSFWAAYTKKTGTETDLLRVSISNDCGQTWLVKKTLSSTVMSSAPAQVAAFTPNSTQWLQHFVTGISSSFLVSGFRFKFELQSDLGNNIYIDDINITGPVSAEELEQTGFSFALVPNPAETEVALNLNAAGADKVTVQITDMAGRIVFENKNLQVIGGMNTFYVPVEALSKGMYLVNVSSEKGVISQKLIKK